MNVIIHENQSDKDAKTTSSGNKKRAVSTLVARRGLSFPMTDGTRAKLNARKLIDST